MLRAAVLVAANDVRIQLRNGTLLVLGFLVPLGLSFVLNLVFGGLDDPDAPVTFDVGAAIVDEAPRAQAFAGVLAELQETGLLDLTTYGDAAAARAAVADGEVDAAWILEEDRPGIQVVADVDATTTAGAAEAIAEAFANRTRAFEIAGGVAAANGEPPPSEIVPLATVVTAAASGERLDPTNTLTAGMALFFLFFTAGLPLASIAAERAGGSLARLLVAPIPHGAILAGKTAAALLLGVVSVSALVVASGVLMGADWPPATLVLVVAAVIAVAGIVAAVGSFARSGEAVTNLQVLVAIALGILGGTFVPVEEGAGGIRGALQSATPNGMFLDGLTALRSDGLAGALPQIGLLLVVGIATGAVGLRRAGRTMRP